MIFNKPLSKTFLTQKGLVILKIMICWHLVKPITLAKIAVQKKMPNDSLYDSLDICISYLFNFLKQERHFLLQLHLHLVDQPLLIKSHV